MTLSKRERYIATGTIVVVVILGLDYFFISPRLARYKELESQIQLDEQELSRGKLLAVNSLRLQKRWQEMMSGPLKRDYSEAESQSLGAIFEWASNARLAVSSAKPERTDKEKAFQKITFRVTAAGNMEQVSRFIYNIQHAPVPAHITDLQINAKDPNRATPTDELTLTIGIATIFLPPEPVKSAS